MLEIVLKYLKKSRSSGLPLKEINPVGGKTLYNVVVICTPQVMMEIKDIWGKAFESTEFVFVCNKNTEKRG